MMIFIVFFKSFILMYSLNIQTHISLVIGNLYLVITGISSNDNSNIDNDDDCLYCYSSNG